MPHFPLSVDRNKIPCPMCGEGKNSESGTPRCFHCDSCDYVECIFCDCLLKDDTSLE